MKQGLVKIPDWVKTSYQLDAYIELIREEFTRQQYMKADATTKETWEEQSETV